MTAKPEIPEGVNDTFPDEEGIVYQAPNCDCAYIYDDGGYEWLRCREHEDIELRPELETFAQFMEMRLRANDWKGGRQNMTTQEILTRIAQETAELRWAAERNMGASAIRQEAADIANFCLFMADNFGRSDIDEPS